MTSSISAEAFTNKNRASSLLTWLPLLGILIPLVGYLLLPAFGINLFSEALGLKRLLLLFGAIIGSILYGYYLKLILLRPQLLVGFILLAWPLVNFFNEILLMKIGINIHLRPLLILAIALPSLWLTVKNFRFLINTVSWLKYYLLFFSWLVLYFIFFNAHAIDPRLSGGEEALLEGSASMVQLTSYFYCLMAITISAITILKVRNYKGLFDLFNMGLLFISSIEALITIAGYPFGLFHIILDGFTRAIGIFTHPNPFAHHMGVLMVYLMGLFCYYQGEQKHRVPGALLYGGIIINFIVFLLGLSKTALGVFALCSTLIFLMNLAVPVVRRSFIQIMIGLIVLLPVGLFAFELLSGNSFFELLESRMTQTQSLNWRTMIWQDLMANITPVSMWFGHGFTAANDMVFHLTFNDANNAQPLMMVHNAYIALLYDFGIMGYSMFVTTAALIVQSLRHWAHTAQSSPRTLYSIILALTVYFLIVCGFDEMSYMFDAPLLFWTLVTLLYCVNVRDQQADALRETGATR